MKPLAIRGYCDRPNVRPGEVLDVFVSSPHPGNYQASRCASFTVTATPPARYREEAITSTFAGSYPARAQRTQVGAYVAVPDPDAQLAGSAGFTVQCFVWPTLPNGRQGVLGRWSEQDGQGWALAIEEGHLVLLLGDAQGTTRVISPKPLFPEAWYAVAARYDAATGVATLTQRLVLNSVNSRYGRVVDIDGDATLSAPPRAPAVPDVPLIMAGLAESAAAPRTWVVANYNGKLDSPRFYARALDDAELAQLQQGLPVAGAQAHWDFAADIGLAGVPSDRATDVSGHELHGLCVNQPDRGMTGWNWQGREEHFVHAPAQYGALWFHDDSLDDCRWERDFCFTVPSDLPSGAYAIKLEQDGRQDRIPFFVVPPRGRPGATIAVVLPTFSYIAYANSQVMQNAPTAQAIMGVLTTLDDLDLELHTHPHYGRSTYDYHHDGRGVHSSWRHFNMRPDYRHEFGSVWQFPADLHHRLADRARACVRR